MGKAAGQTWETQTSGEGEMGTVDSLPLQSVFVSHVSVFVDTPFWLYSRGEQQTAAALSCRRSGLVKLF